MNLLAIAAAETLPIMTEKQENIIYRTRNANSCAESAYWWMKKIDPSDIDDLGVMSKIKDTLDLLQMVDNLTIDIIISIKSKNNSDL